MNLSRSDTYINVYIPREDGGDPRKLIPLTSPVFDMTKIYKFSEEVKKDRQLFLGKKQVSLYDLYYKVSKEHTENKTKKMEKEDVSSSEDEGEEEEEGEEHHHCDTIDTPNAVKKVSLSLESKVKKSRKPRRFNEPLDSYVAKQKKIMMNRTDSEQNLGRQISSYDLLKLDRQQTVYENRARQQTFYDNNERQRALFETRERQRTFYDNRDRQQSFYSSRQNTFYDSSFRSQSFPTPKKSLSAMETRIARNLGLPPINLGNQATQSPVLYGNFRAIPSKSMSKPIPIRPSSKPQKIWKRSTEVLLDGRTPRINNAGNRFLAIQPQYHVTGAILGQYAAY